MKRLLSLAGFVIILSLVPLTSVWAVWEGNAGIGAASDFPGSGLYARSDMFPKNTVVEIKNLETEKTVRAVITGASGVPGLVAVLSPETASALSIKAGSVCRVRIFIPTVTERPADGTIVDSTKPTNADPDANPAAAVTQSKDSEVPLETIAESPKDPLVALAPASAPAPVESAATSAPASAPTTAPAPAASETPAAASPSAAAVAVPETADAESAAAAPVETAPATGDSSPAAVGSAAPAEPAAQPIESVAAAPASSSSPTAEPELAVAPASSSETESDVSLVPAEPLPPASPAAAVAKTDVPVVDAPSPVPPATASASAIPEASPVEQSAKTAQPTPTAPVAAAPASAMPTASDVSVVSSLAKGSYYIQIGTYGDMSNVKKIVDKYGAKYPFTVEKGVSKGAETLKVYVGPVKKDEYGAVLERFRQLGFKDAFVRKGQ